MKIIFLFFILVFTFKSSAQISVAFFEVRDSKGEIVSLEAGGQFVHVAISYYGGWLHSYPGLGVSWVQSVYEIGDPHTILENKDIPALTAKQVTSYFGLPFDKSYRWHPKDSTYCSKLVGQLLNIPPQPMSFSGSAWGEVMVKGKGRVGLSPDDLYQELPKMGFKPVSKLKFINFKNCKDIF